MQKWEYKKLFVMLEEGKLFLLHSGKIVQDQEVLEFINSLGKVGWELVNIVDEIGNERPRNKTGKLVASLFDFAIAGPRVTPMTQYRTVTLGYHLWFRRPYEPKVCKKCKAENNFEDSFCRQCGTKLD
jgi:hypothetical protein